MGLFELALVVYFVIGFIYATYILLFAGDPWYLFPVNVLFGTIALIYNTYLVLTRPKRIL